jgi:hypothetical protein
MAVLNEVGEAERLFAKWTQLHLERAEENTPDVWWIAEFVARLIAVGVKPELIEEAYPPGPSPTEEWIKRQFITDRES